MRQVLGRTTRYFVLFERPSEKEKWMLRLCWFLGIVALWQLYPSALLPKPAQVLRAFADLNEKGFAEYFWQSLTVLAMAVMLAFAVSLLIASLSLMPAFRPLGEWVSSLRLLSPSPLIMIAIFSGLVGDSRKIFIMVFVTSTYYVPALMYEFDQITRDDQEYVMSLRLSHPLQQFWYLAVRGKLPQIFLSFFPNAGMCWSLLPMVEALSKSAGGLGVLLHGEERGLNFPSIFAITLTMWVVGVACDALGKAFIRKMFPYYNLKQFGGGKK